MSKNTLPLEQYMQPHLQNQQADVDMTPMLDIVFIMLIFFIVSTSFLRPIGLDVLRPVASMHPGNPADNVRIQIKENGDIWMGNRLVDVMRIPANIETLISQGYNELVLVDADTKTKHQLVVSVLDQVKTVEGLDVSIVSKK